MPAEHDCLTLFDSDQWMLATCDVHGFQLRVHVDMSTQRIEDGELVVDIVLPEVEEPMTTPMEGLTIVKSLEDDWEWA